MPARLSRRAGHRWWGPSSKGIADVDPGEPVEVAGDGPRFVSRGGEKLDAALDQFGIDVSDRRVIDTGSSTGGFTDVSSSYAAEVVAIDVGRNHPRTAPS